MKARFFLAYEHINMSKSATKKHSYTHKIRMAVNRNKKHNADKKAGQKPNPKKNP